MLRVVEQNPPVGGERAVNVVQGKHAKVLALALGEERVVHDQLVHATAGACEGRCMRGRVHEEAGDRAGVRAREKASDRVRGQRTWPMLKTGSVA